MELELKKDLSVYYFVKNLFSIYPTVTVVDSFPTGNLVIPSISIDAGRITVPPFELGNRSGIFIRYWNVDVFADNKGQRDELCYKLLNALENTIPVYDFDLGFDLNSIPILNYLEPLSIEMNVINVNPNLVSTLYYRANVRFSTKPVLF